MELVGYCRVEHSSYGKCMQFIYYIAGNFSQIDGKYNFHRENGLLAFATPKDATPPNFAKKQQKKTNQIATKLQNLRKFPLYMVFDDAIMHACDTTSFLYSHI